MRKRNIDRNMRAYLLVFAEICTINHSFVSDYTKATNNLRPLQKQEALTLPQQELQLHPNEYTKK
jgi:hypothetical protein